MTFSADKLMDLSTDELLEKLLSMGKKFATAESCTGGLIASLLTELPGSSATYLGGVSVYSNHAKEQLLTVPSKVLEEHGAVSEIVAKIMADNVRIKLDADFSVAVTGIAGPTGATRNKPVGTVWIGLASAKTAMAKHHLFKGSRKEVRAQAAKVALYELISFVESASK